MKKPCHKAGCPALVDGGQQYCERHQKFARRPWKKKCVYGQQAKTTARGYGYAWQKKRLLVLNEQPLCQIAKVCVERLGHPALSNCVDHIVPKAAGGTDDWDNLQGACTDCNEDKARTADRLAIEAAQRTTHSAPQSATKDR